MAKKSPSSKKGAPQSSKLFSAAIAAADIDGVRQLLANGHKPDEDAVEQARQPQQQGPRNMPLEGENSIWPGADTKADSKG
jgi:hypothetical protein